MDSNNHDEDLRVTLDSFGVLNEGPEDVKAYKAMRVGNFTPLPENITFVVSEETYTGLSNLLNLLAIDKVNRRSNPLDLVGSMAEEAYLTGQIELLDILLTKLKIVGAAS
jgi:hypothetical protein